MSMDEITLEVDVPFKKSKRLTRARTINFDEQTSRILAEIDEQGVQVNEWIRRLVQKGLPHLMEKLSDNQVA